LFQHQQSISEILEKELLSGNLLYRYGILFTDFEDQSLEDVCRLRSLNLETILIDLEEWIQLRNQPAISDLENLPADLLIAYLKSGHQQFLWERIPYMMGVINSLDESDFVTPEIARDLKMVFPLFAEDFIHHIHEEEDTFFNYTLQLLDVAKKRINPASVYFKMTSNSIFQFAEDHLEEDDEMRGIREFTFNYHLPTSAGLKQRVIYAELQAFEQELKKHAQIENELLFPKALKLEKQVHKILDYTSKYN
jgi:regulator of cell morphogenesis and NO signaling